MQLQDIRRRQMFNTRLWVGGLQVANAACLENIKALSAKIIASFGKSYFFIANMLCLSMQHSIVHRLTLFIMGYFL